MIEIIGSLRKGDNARRGRLQGRSERDFSATAKRDSLAILAICPSGVEPPHFQLLTDEFAEIRLEGLRVLSREELRKVCDERKEEIVRALSGY